MRKKQEESVLGLPPLMPMLPSFSETGLSAYTQSHELTPRETAIVENFHEDQLIITVFNSKAHLGMEEMNELKSFAATDVWFTFQQIDQVRSEAQGTSCQQAMEEFCKYLTTLSARHTLGVVEVSASRIAEVVGESVLPPPPPPPEPKKGFFARLFGG